MGDNTQQGVPDGGLQKRTKIAYGVGAVGKDMVYMLVASYILYYYNSVLGVSSVFIGTVLITVCLADSIDYGEYKNGQRDESVICSMQTFVVKLASGVAVFFAGLAIKWVGLVQSADGTSEVIEQSTGTLMGLSMMMTVVPIVLLIIGLVFFIRKYKLTEERMQEIMTKLR